MPASLRAPALISLPEAVTWWATTVGVAESGSVETALKEDLRLTLEEFATAYIEANTEEDDSGGR